MPREMAASPISRGHRSGFVGLIGKPNVGKSTLLNALLGRKVSITSPRPQTTRTRILGILTRPDAQVIFLDTPGWHKPQHPLGRSMVAAARDVMEEADVLVAILDVTSGITQEDEWVFDEVRKAKRPALLAINKVDAVNKGLILPLLEQAAATGLFAEHIPVSAAHGDNLDVLMAQLLARLPEGPRWYEPEQVTDQTMEQLMQEFIREQVLRATRQEVPHAVGILLEGVTRKDRAVVIQAVILVEREGQKAIVIGRRGQMLKHIGTEARKELERLLGKKVFLELWVKVAKDWRSDPSLLSQLGYHAKEAR